MSEQGGKAMKRRGILAAAGAVVAGVVAKGAIQPVRATSGTGGQGSLVLASNPIDNTANTATRPTYVFNTAGGTPSVGSFVAGDAFLAASVSGAGLIGRSTSNVGVDGVSDQFHGIIGQTGTGSGHAGIAGFGAGSNTFGVIGDGAGGGGSTMGAVGVQGQNAQFGVVGQSTGANGVGVQGTSTTDTGVVGSGPTGVNGNTTAVGGYGGFFTTTAPQSSAVGGQIFGTTSGSAAFVGAAGAGNFAAFFTGQVSINGSLFVSGGAKSAAVKHPRTNDYRALYCEESPESWFSDYGKGILVNGQAEVKLDPDFAALIHTEDYHVFLTPYGSLGALRVATQRGDGFAVEEIGGSGSGSGTFSYRVVGRRSDLKLDRLAKVTMPSIKLASEPPKNPGVVCVTDEQC